MHKYYAPISIMFAGLLVGLSVIYWGHPGSNTQSRSMASKAAATVDHSMELPPIMDAKGQAPYVNMDRMKNFARQPSSKGPSPTESYADIEKMIAEKKKATR